MSTEQAELDQLASLELTRLQRHLRKHQCDLENLLDEKRNQLLKQTNLISVLQNEYNKIKFEVLFSEKGAHKKKELHDEEKFEKVCGIYKKQQIKLKTEKTTFLELENHIKKIEKELNVLKKKEVPDTCYKESMKQVKKNVIKLENRLDVVNKKNSNVITDILKLRELIDHILQDRTNFNEMWQSMVTQFNEGKKYIMDLVDQSTIAFDQREELCIKLQALKERSETDKMVHIQEMREVQRKLEHDAKLQNFYDVKGHKRVNLELEARENNKRLQLKYEFEKQIAEYHTLIEKIKNISQENVIDAIFSQFSTQEEENFALFNYVNELGHEVEVLNEIVDILTVDIEKQKHEFKEVAIMKKTETREHLQEIHNSLQLEVDNSVEHKLVVNNELQLLLKGIENLFKLIKCQDIPILSVLSSKSTLTVDNVYLFLGIVAKKINTLITSLYSEEVSNKILSKKDRIPKFNIKDLSK